MMYGLPFKGSKNKIAEDIINILPAGNRFCDLFGGGGAMTHCALLSGKYKEVLYNEYAPIVYDYFTKAINGEILDKNGEIKQKYLNVDRYTFNEQKDKDGIIAFCYSFANTGDYYLYDKDIEKIKLTASRMLTLPTLDQRRTQYREFLRLVSDYGKIEQLEHLTRLKRVKNAERERESINY